MRNLIQAHCGVVKVESQEAPDLRLSHLELDPILDTVLCTFAPSGDDSGFNYVEVQQLQKDTAQSATSLGSWPVEDANIKVRNTKHFGDSGSSIVILSNGDIVSIGGDSGALEVVGTIEGGVVAAEWSPDEEILAIVCGNSSIMLLSRSLEPISEVQYSVEDLRISRHVSVGWGKKETQFEGKGAKAAAAAMRDPTVPEHVDRGDASQLDSDSCVVSLTWRGDGEYFAVSTLDVLPTDNVSRRTIRVYNRSGVLDSVSEPVDGLEPQIAWRPSGNVIASIQRVAAGDETKLKVIFFERNGLKRNEFDLRSSSQSLVQGLVWSADSEILAVVFTTEVQLWTSSNYHWHLKQVLPVEQTGSTVAAKFHPEKLRTLFVYGGQEIATYTFVWDTIHGPLSEPHDLGTTVVVDGSTVKITPLKLANTPPPMAFREFTCASGATPIHVAVSKSNQELAVLDNNGVGIYKWNVADDVRVCDIKSPELVNEYKFSSCPVLSSLSSDKLVPKQVAMLDSQFVAVAFHDPGLVAGVAILDTLNGEWSVLRHSDQMPVFILKAQSDYAAFVYETIDGQVYTCDPDTGTIEPLAKLTTRCTSFEVDGPSGIVFGLSSSGRFYANSRLLSQGVTSLMLTQRYAVVTTAQHLLKFCHIPAFGSDERTDALSQIQIPNDQDSQIDERCRSIERGSLLVSLIPSKTALVLQAPRGNLETIHPRIMVLGEVRKYLRDAHYDKAFMLCRTHRVDLNILHDYLPSQFHASLKAFVRQLGTCEYIDLFLSGIKDEDVCQTMYKETLEVDGDVGGETVAPKLNQESTSSSKINIVCDALISVLATDPKWFQSLLTAYACKSPPDLESALGRVGELHRDSDPKNKGKDKAEQAIEHLCFLQDVNLLYSTALGIYDLDLALLVAQRSQMDPKECLPFLRSLQQQPTLRRKFNIDKHLRKYAKALGSLIEIDDAFESELTQFVVDHALYREALSLLHASKSQSDVQQKINKINTLYAEYLAEQDRNTDAGILFEKLGDKERALTCYSAALDWKRALSVCNEPVAIKELATSLAERLLDSHNTSDAAFIYLQYLNDSEEAIRAYCKGCHFDDAIRVVSMTSSSAQDMTLLFENLVDPLLLESFGQILELVADCAAQIKSQVNRLRELRAKKEEDPFKFYGDDNRDIPDNVSLAPTESTTAPSFFTRYTGKTGGTAQTGVSRKTSKNRRREERKRARGKKGSVYEEEYLVNSMGRLVERLNQTINEACRLRDGLLRRNKDTHAQQIQSAYVTVLKDASAVIQEVYTISERDRQRYDDEGNMYLVPELTVPVINEFPTRDFIVW